MQCPSCGTPVEVHQGHAHLAVCGSCRTSFIVDEEVARISGEMAALAQATGPLFVGGTGRVGEKNVTVLGRVRYGYQQGYWDEWYLLGDDGVAFWVGEDEATFTASRCVELEGSTLTFDAVGAGDEIELAGSTWHVDEKGVARCEGGEGQLPFEIHAGEDVPFLDLAGDGAFATVEFEDGKLRFFEGRRIERDEISMDFEGGGAGGLAAERDADDHGRKRVVRKKGRTQRINCDACAAPLEVPDTTDDSMACEFCGVQVDLRPDRIHCASCDKTVAVRGGPAAAAVVCPHCKTQLSVADDKIGIVASLVDARRPRLPVQLGQRCRFDGLDLVVVGHIRYTERDDGVSYHTDEFVLHGEDTGYRWLSFYNGHASFGQETGVRPKGFNPKRSKRKQSFSVMDQRWRVFEVNRGTNKVTFVDGELPWIARVGDLSGYMDAIDPPFMLSAEWTESEVEWYHARYVPREELAKAFGLPVSALPRPRGIAPNQPDLGWPKRKPVMLVAMLFAAINLVLLLHSLVVPESRVVGEYTMNHGEYSQEFLTPTFTIAEDSTVCMARFAAPVDNSWVYMDVAVVDADGKALMDFSAECSYYHGVEGGESWSEGSRDDSVSFKIDKAGEYRFLVLGQAGRGNSESPGTSGPLVSVKVYEGVILSRWFLTIFVITAIVALWIAVLRLSFEGRRWKDE